jgi:molecular chaperone GrpE
MTDPNRPNDDAANPAQTGEPLVSKPYIARKRSRKRSAGATKEAAEALTRSAHAGGNGKAAQAHRQEVAARGLMASPVSRATCWVSDGLRRRSCGSGQAKATADPGLKALIEGVELTERSLLNTLEKNGVKKFDPSGEKFDPNFQQAMYEVPDPSVPAGTVVQVVQAGYTIGERVFAPGAGRGLQGWREGRSGALGTGLT